MTAVTTPKPGPTTRSKADGAPDNLTATVLLVDHSDSAREMRRALEGAGYEVAHVAEGEDPVATFAAARFDVVVTAAGRSDGLSVLQRLRGSGPPERGRSVPVIVLDFHGDIVGLPVPSYSAGRAAGSVAINPLALASIISITSDISQSRS